MTEREASLYEAPFAYALEKRQTGTRDANQRRAYRSDGGARRPRPEMWDALNSRAATRVTLYAKGRETSAVCLVESA